MHRHPRLLRIALIIGGLVLASSTVYAQHLQWNANTEPDLAGYRVYQGTQSGVYSAPIDVGNVTTYTPQGVDWTKFNYFAVQAYNTSGMSSPLSAEAVWTPASLTTFSSLTSSSGYPLVSGTSVTWTANASNNLGAAVQYRFFVYKKTAWVLVQDYGSSNTYTWTPGLSDAGGPYYVQVWARAVGSTAAYDAWGETPSFNVVAAPLTLTSDVDFPTPTGNQVTWTATLGAPGTAPVQYKFQVVNVTANTTTLLQDYSSSNKAQWTPQTAGTYVIQGMERLVGSTNPYDLLASSPQLPVSATTLSITGFSTPTTFPAPTGTPITWTARVQGGMAGPIEYAFWRYSAATSSWVNVQPYGPGETWTWTPTWTDQGDYAMQVWVRSNASTAAYDAFAGTSMFHIQQATLHLTTPALFPVAVGTPVVWTGNVPDPSVNMQYEFWLYSYSAAQWSLGQAYSAQQTYTWTPLVTGSYAVQAWARKVGSTSTYDLFTTVDQTNVVSAPPQVVSLTSNVWLPAAAGTSITWTAGATGGTAPLQYQFWRQDGATWNMVQDYSAQTTYTWSTTSTDVGTHALQVRVRSTGSTAAFEAQMTTAVFNIQ